MMNENKTCPNCNHAVKPTWKICPYCKQRLLETSSRDNGVEFPKNDYEGPLNAIDYSRRSTKSSGCMWFGIAACVIFILIKIVAVAMLGNDSYYGDLNLNDSAEIPEDDFVRDSRDGKVYRTVEIQGQTWMAQNLNFATSSGSYCYNNDANSCNTYGRLYTWETAKTACPSGWRLPSKTDFEKLLATVSYVASDFGETASIHLRSKNDWTTQEGDDRSGFSALPAGYRGNYGGFNYAGDGAYFWSASEDNSDRAYRLYISGNYASVGGSGKTYGFSVRCLQN